MGLNSQTLGKYLHRNVTGVGVLLVVGLSLCDLTACLYHMILCAAQKQDGGCFNGFNIKLVYSKFIPFEVFFFCFVGICIICGMPLFSSVLSKFE